MSILFAEAFGETPKRAEVITIIAIGCLGTALLVLGDPTLFGGVALWRAALAVLITFDIVSGCLANFTRSTNEYYRRRPKARLLFFAVHLHLIAFALLLEVELLVPFLVSIYAIMAALLVNGMSSRDYQPLAAAGQVIIGLIWIPLWSGLPTILIIIGLLFLLKLVLAFAVDHFPAALHDIRRIEGQWHQGCQARMDATAATANMLLATAARPPPSGIRGLARPNGRNHKERADLPAKRRLLPAFGNSSIASMSWALSRSDR